MQLEASGGGKNCLEVSHLVGVKMLSWHLVNVAIETRTTRRGGSVFRSCKCEWISLVITIRLQG